YFPLIGETIAQLNRELSAPSLLGWGGFAWGRESITVQDLDVPMSMEGRKIRLTATGDGSYSVSLHGSDITGNGKVGTPLSIATPAGPVRLLVSALEARPDA